MEAAREHNSQHMFLQGEWILSRSLVCEEECCQVREGSLQKHLNVTNLISYQDTKLHLLAGL